MKGTFTRHPDEQMDQNRRIFGKLTLPTRRVGRGRLYAYRELDDWALNANNTSNTINTKSNEAMPRYQAWREQRRM